VISWKVINDGILYAAEDIWWHVIWLKEFTAELNEGWLYPRWLAQSNFLYGSPTFVFYPPGCYYLGALLQKIFALTTMQATTALSVLANFACACSLYFSARGKRGEIAAVAGALVFMTAPFVVFDIYFRACIPELCAFTWLPIIMLGVDNLERRSWQIWSVAAFFCLALTHVPSLFLYMLAWSTRLLFCAATANASARDSASTSTSKSKSKSASLRTLRHGIGVAAVGLSLASFFLLPVVLERSLVDITAVVDMVKLQASLVGAKIYCAHEMMPDIVLTSTGEAVLLFLLIAILGLHKKIPRRALLEPGYWLALNLGTAFLMSALSRQIWLTCQPLQFLQFPTRWMTINCFATAVLFVLAVQSLSHSSVKKYLKVLIGLLLFCLFARQAGFDYVVTKYRSGIDRPTAYIVENGAMQGRDEYARFMMPTVVNGSEGFPGSPEYRPLIQSAGQPPKAPPTPHHGRPAWSVTEGRATVEVTLWKSFHRILQTDAGEKSIVSIRCFAYPAWRLSVDGMPVEQKQAADGSMLVSIPPGRHIIDLSYGDTFAFSTGKIISAITLVTCLLWLLFCTIFSHSRD